MLESEEVLYTPQEVSKKLKLCLATVYRLIRSGRLGAFKFGPKAWRVSETDLQKFYEEYRANSSV